jgi:translin
MTRLHAGNSSASDAKEVRRELRRLSEDLPTSYPGDEGLAEDALQEGDEALLLIAVMERTDFPSHEELGVPPESYLLGLGDVVGEVRRLVLTELTRGDVVRAAEMLAVMESIYRTLLGFETTRAIVSLKPKQDTARALVERTRGEVTMARLLHRAGVPVSGPEGSS